MNIILFFAAFLTGIFASLGLGGGMILILYLTLIENISQIQSQGINLLFFIPIASISLFFHTKNKLVKWKKIVPAIICGSLTAIAGTYVARIIGNDYLTKIFAVFVFITGIRELFSKTKDQ